MMPLKILLIDAPIGNGHKQAAAAVGKALQVLQPDCTVRFLNIFECIPKRITAFFLRIYLDSLAVFPQGYAHAYAWGNESKAALYGRQLMSYFLARDLKKMLADFSPDAVICTHAAAAAAVEYLLSKEGIRFYHAGIVTDFVIHRLWINPKVDDYFIADEQLKTEKILKLIPAERFHAFGIPTLVPAKQANITMPVLERADGKTILIMGGGEGLLPMPCLLEKLNVVQIPLHLIFLTGNHFKMRQELQSMAAESDHQVTVLPFVHYVMELMQCADLLISKAGGLSASEALCAGLPMLLYCPLPGQEKANADFLIKAGAAREIANIEDFPAEVDKIFRLDNAIIQEMKSNARHIAKPDAALHIAKYILNKLCN